MHGENLNIRLLKENSSARRKREMQRLLTACSCSPSSFLLSFLLSLHPALSSGPGFDPNPVGFRTGESQMFRLLITQKDLIPNNKVKRHGVKSQKKEMNKETGVGVGWFYFLGS